MLHLGAVGFVDSQGAAKLAEIRRLTDATSIALRLANVRPQVLAVLQADGTVVRIGADRVHAAR